MGNVLRKIVAISLAFVMLLGSAEAYFAYTKGEPVRVGIFDMDGFHSYDEEGNLTGFCVEYLNVIASVTGWEYEFVDIKDFMQGLEMLENQELDLLAPAMMTDARKENFSYSEFHFGMEYSVLLTRQDRDDLFYEDYANYDGMKVAVLNGYPMTDYFITNMQTNEFNAELVYYDTSEECKAALRNGEVDALCTSIFYYEDEFKLLDSFSPQPFYFMTYRENTELLGELNTAMSRVEDTYPTLLEELLHTYYPIYESQFLTREETEYIEKDKVLRVAYVGDRKPLSFTDTNGELAGISRAIFDEIAKHSGLKFEYVALPDGDITYDYLQEQKIDLITGVEYNKANMSSAGVFLSRPYVSARKVLVSKSNFVYKADESYKLAIVSGSRTFKDVVSDKYPNMNIVEYETVDECFNALYREEVDVLLQNQYVVEAIMGKPVYSSFSVVPVEGISDELCFSTIVPLDGGYGLSEEESSIVISILNKTIAQISEEEMDNIVMREVVANQYDLELADFLYSYRFTIAIVSFALLVVCILLIIAWRQKKRVQAIEEKEQRLKELQQKRYQTIIDCSDDLIYEISMEGDSSVGSERIKEKFGWEIPRGSQSLDFKRAMEILHVYPEDEPIFRQTDLAKGQGFFDELTLRLCKEDGTPIWCHLSRTVLVDKNGRPVSILGKIVDVDDEVKEKQKLEQKSRTDLLTGLLNKQAFEKEVREYVEAHPTESACFVFIDMDHFKDINDKFGHSVGDQVIRETAKKIQLLFANFDLVGRFGGDEFCVFVKDIPRDTLIDRLRFAVKKMEQEYTYEGGSVKISASIGAAYCKRNTVGYKELMDVADSAAYQAKDNGRNCYIIKDVE
ncbi:MAG: transporter substrate-binding domain-containing protein [Agathobacter sp.]|nr:transporter substrate-binding domain-containing protein [Agathobacter sp.]